MNLVPQIKLYDNRVAEVEEVKRGICPHLRHRTVIKHQAWRCRKCGLLRVLGVNSLAEELNNNLSK